MVTQNHYMHKGIDIGNSIGNVIGNTKGQSKYYDRENNIIMPKQVLVLLLTVDKLTAILLNNINQ